MLWLVLGGVLVGLVAVACVVSATTHHESSAPGRGKDAGHARLGKGAAHTGSARYRNRGSAKRQNKSESP